MNEINLPENPKLQDFQKYIANMVVGRGFDKETVPQMFMMLMEECGELAKAARKASGIHTDTASEKFKLEHEAADVFIYLLDICNKFDIDLEKAFREKEELNKTRTWGK
jgi:NTP pyrophosphatase (non-canonical NTP hydrolase)